MLVLQEFVLIIREGISTLVLRLLIQELSLQEVGHLGGSCLIVVAVQTQILLGLLYTALGKKQLLVGFLHTVPGILHTNLQQL